MVFFTLQLTLLPLKLMDVPEKVETEIKSPYREVLKKTKRDKETLLPLRLTEWARKGRN